MTLIYFYGGFSPSNTRDFSAIKEKIIMITITIIIFIEIKVKFDITIEVESYR